MVCIKACALVYHALHDAQAAPLVHVVSPVGVACIIVILLVFRRSLKLVAYLVDAFQEEL